jgi:hypothetical protein
MIEDAHSPEKATRNAAPKRTFELRTIIPLSQHFIVEFDPGIERYYFQSRDFGFIIRLNREITVSQSVY